METGRAPGSAWIHAVLGFWYDELRPKDWWSASPEVDARISERFATLYKRLAQHPPAPASLDARGHLAAILAFDQFPRHLFRRTRDAFATDATALALLDDALDRNLDASLSVAERQFLYMPLMHAEDAERQRQSVALFEALGDREGLRSAKAHRDTIARFGRFPYRNAALGRVPTPDERAFLEKHPGSG